MDRDEKILSIEQARALDSSSMAADAVRSAQQANLEALMIYYNLPLKEQKHYQAQILEILEGLIDLA